MIAEQLDFDQYLESEARKLLLEWEARKKREAEREGSTAAHRITKRFGIYSVFSESDFFSNVNKECANTYNGTPCWEWTGKLTRDWWNPDKPGYGQYGGMYAQVFLWTIILGRNRPTGMHLHHKCEFRPYVNADHLEILTSKEHRQRHAYALQNFVRIADDMSDYRFQEVLDGLFFTIRRESRLQWLEVCRRVQESATVEADSMEAENGPAA